jgi:hypothetical protein
MARSLSAGNANATAEFHATALTEVAGTGYDVVTAIAVVHHLDLSEALTAMRRSSWLNRARAAPMPWAQMVDSPGESRPT